VTAPARRLAVAFTLLIAAGVAVWLLWLRGERPKPPAEPPPETAEESPPRAELPATRPRPAPPTPPPARPLEYGDDGIPIMPPGPNDPRPDGPVHPHPITPRHERIFRENHLVGQLNGAMDVKDFAGMRRLLEEYRRDYPEDDNMLQDGYAIVADCLERPGDAAARAAAVRWGETHRGSTLRRFVNRHCIEPAGGQ
jgi:hypothetical protein